jgi:signal transduction histidine kinase
MNINTRKIVSVTLFIVLISLTVITLFSNGGNRFVLGILLSALISSFCLKKYIYFFTPRYSAAVGVLAFFDLFLINRIAMYALFYYWDIYFYLQIIDFVLFFPGLYGSIYSVLVYVSYIYARYVRFIKWNYFSFDIFAPALYDKLFYFFAFTIFTLLLKWQIDQRMRLLELTKNLEAANAKLKDTIDGIEELTIVKERNRIAREIHDILGHTLTTVLVEMEAGKRLMLKNPENSMQKFSMAQDQVRKGLQEIRKSVRALSDEESVASLSAAARSLIYETEKHASVKINVDFMDTALLNKEQDIVLFRALREGLTNGIRHGGSTEFGLSVKRVGGNIVFELEDNGKGTIKIEYGYGLSVLKQQVYELGGRLSVSAKKNEGSRLSIQLPLCRENRDDSDNNCR